MLPHLTTKNYDIARSSTHYGDDLKNHFLEQYGNLKIELEKPTVNEVSFDMVYTILKGFSKFLKSAEPENQKDLLHSVINKITVNTGNSPDERSVKEIELFFDASIKNDFVLTYDTVPHA